MKKNAFLKSAGRKLLAAVLALLVTAALLSLPGGSAKADGGISTREVYCWKPLADIDQLKTGMSLMAVTRINGTCYYWNYFGRNNAFQPFKTVDENNDAWKRACADGTTEFTTYGGQPGSEGITVAGIKRKTVQVYISSTSYGEEEVLGLDLRYAEAKLQTGGFAIGGQEDLVPFLTSIFNNQLFRTYGTDPKTAADSTQEIVLKGTPKGTELWMTKATNRTELMASFMCVTGADDKGTPGMMLGTLGITDEAVQAMMQFSYHAALHLFGSDVWLYCAEPYTETVYADNSVTISDDMEISVPISVGYNSRLLVNNGAVLTVSSCISNYGAIYVEDGAKIVLRDGGIIVSPRPYQQQGWDQKSVYTAPGSLFVENGCSLIIGEGCWVVTPDGVSSNQLDPDLSETRNMMPTVNFALESTVVVAGNLICSNDMYMYGYLKIMPRGIVTAGFSYKQDQVNPDKSQFVSHYKRSRTNMEGGILTPGNTSVMMFANSMNLLPLYGVSSGRIFTTDARIEKNGILMALNGIVYDNHGNHAKTVVIDNTALYWD